jgi:DNA-binding transcriptional MerR regulator
MTAVPARSLMSIGEVLAALRPDFPDVTISKIRFLESEGLVEPARTPSGYRKFSHGDVERLRYVLSAQREQYLPLRVIKEYLDAIDRGLEPPQPAGAPSPRRTTCGSRARSYSAPPRSTPRSLTRSRDTACWARGAGPSTTTATLSSSHASSPR